jgi:cytochrome c oxidase subunit 4
MAINPYHLGWSQNTRGYTLLGLMVTLSFLGLVRARQSPSDRPAWLLYVVCSTVAIYTHLSTVFVVAAQGLAVLLTSRRAFTLQYIKVALVLATITGIEVAVYYVSAVRSVLVPMLLTFSIVKFALVALWFMHLRFDNRLFRRLFVTGLVLASGVYLVVLTTFHVWTRGRS